MIIGIRTIRKFSDNEYDNWIYALRKEGININSEQLKKTGEWSFESDLGYTKAKTVYKIVGHPPYKNSQKIKNERNKI